MCSSDAKDLDEPIVPFDRLFAGDEDPWNYRSSWYEARKRDVTLACLDRPRYQRGFEPGCANGVLSSALAARCQQLLVSDASPSALAHARKALASMSNVAVRCGRVPRDWPDGTFDLIVLSEFVYYLAPSDVDQLAGLVRGSLRQDGTVLACHWRQPIEGYSLDAETTHARLDGQLGLSLQTRVIDADFLLDVWREGPLSVAARERGC